jgi:tetratricopeptide (TPR) repeat protein
MADSKKKLKRNVLPLILLGCCLIGYSFSSEASERGPQERYAQETSPTSFLQEYERCNEFFQARPSINAVFASVECFHSLAERALKQEDLTLFKRATESGLLARFFLGLEYQKQGNKAAIAELLSQGKTIAEQLIKQLPATGSGYYWRASYQSALCDVVGGRPSQVRCILAEMSGIRRDMLAAKENEPEYHGYGPYRIYGIMMREAPTIAGGDLGVSAENLSFAYEKAPELTLNGLEYAKTLLRQKKNREAIRILERILERKPNELPSGAAHDLEVDQDEARRILRAIRR